MRSSSTRHRIALVALTGLLLAGHVGTPDRTSAAFTGTASTQGVVATAPACTGGPAGYTSGLLDDASPLLRWSFSGATPDAGGPAGNATPGLLVCDPVDLASHGDTGTTGVRSLDLAGSVGGGLTSAPVVPSGSVTLLLWVQAGEGDGEIASLSVATPDPAPELETEVEVEAPADAAGTDPARAAAPAPPPDALVVGLVGATVQLSEVRGGTTTVLASAPVVPGEAHLVTAVVAVAGDGTPRVTLAVDDGTGTAPVPLATPVAGASLTVGARPSATAAVARVDEVTVLAGEVDAVRRGSLLAADRWWSTASASVPSP